MADDEKRVRVIFEAVGGAEAAEGVDRLKEALGGVEEAAEDAGEGTEELKATIDSLTARLAQLEAANDSAATKTKKLEDAQREVAQKTIQLVQGIAGATGAISGLAAALGGADSGLAQGAGLVNKLATAGAAGAQLGMQFGPQGALVGGILGALIPAIAELVQETDALTEAMAKASEEQERLEEISNRMSAARQAQIRREVDSGRILTLSQAEITRERLLAEDELQQAVRLRSELEEGATRSGADAARRRAEDLAEYDATIQRLIARIGNLGEAEGRRISDPATRGQGAPVVRERRRGGGGGPSAADTFDANMAEFQANRERGVAAMLALRQREIELIEEGKRREDEFAAATRARAEAVDDLNQQAAEREEARQQAFAARSLERLRRETADRTAQLDRETERRENELTRFSDLATSMSSSLVSAIADIAAGTKTAEEAFLGMLASFMSTIAEMAMIEAAKEYASAIGSFARYDIGSGIQHVAAGVAWTGVAVATGAAAGALSAPSQSAPADSPDRAQGAGSGGGKVTYVNNWNAPVVTAGTYAEVGRTVNRTTDASERRFGRLAA